MSNKGLRSCSSSHSEALRFVSVLEETAKATTLDLYWQAMDEAKLAAQRDRARYYGRPAADWIIQDEGSLLSLDCLHAQFHFCIGRMHHTVLYVWAENPVSSGSCDSFSDSRVCGVDVFGCSTNPFSPICNYSCSSAGPWKSKTPSTFSECSISASVR
jgi:hypothetical protein